MGVPEFNRSRVLEELDLAESADNEATHHAAAGCMIDSTVDNETASLLSRAEESPWIRWLE